MSDSLRESGALRLVAGEEEADEGEGASSEVEDAGTAWERFGSDTVAVARRTGDEEEDEDDEEDEEVPAMFLRLWILESERMGLTITTDPRRTGLEVTPSRRLEEDLKAFMELMAIPLRLVLLRDRVRPGLRVTTTASVGSSSGFSC